MIQGTVTEMLEQSGSNQTNPLLATVGAWSLVHGLSTLLLDGHLRKGFEEGDLTVTQLVDTITCIYTRGLKV